MANYRRSGSGYDYGYDDAYDAGGAGQRWDRSRFESMRARRPPRGGSFSYQEDDYYARGGDDTRVHVEIDEDRRRPSYGRDRGFYEYEDERYSTPRRARPEYLEDRGPVSGREMAPYRRDYEYDQVRRPQRPSYARRQSSLDTYDRRPVARYDEERDINVNLKIESPPPPRRQYREYDYGSPKQDYYAEEDYRDISIRRERERSTYKRSDDYEDRYEYSPPPRPSYQNKRGRTKMPKRLVHRNAILQLGYPFEELEDFYMVRTALGKDQIDEIIKISESYFRESSTSIRVDESKMIAAPEPEGEAEAETEVIETTTTKIIENPTEEDIEKYGASNEIEEKEEVKEEVKESNSEVSRGRGRSTTSEVFEEEKEESKEVVLPERRKERDIKAEIRALEEERRSLKQSRDSRDQIVLPRERERRESDYEVREVEDREVRERDRDTVVRIEKDGNGRLRRSAR